MKKPLSSWYKNNTWNGDINDRFEKQLRYTRNPIHKARFLLEQGSLLLKNPNQNIQEVGQVLLGRLLEDLPEQHSPVLTAQENLADYFFRQKQYEKAAGFYKTVVDYCVAQQSRTNTSSFTDLKWADAILQQNLVEQFEKAYELIMQYPVSLLKTPEQQFYHAELGALLCDRMYKKVEAMEFARAAVTYAQMIKPAAVPNKTTNGEHSMEHRIKRMTDLMEVKAL